MWAEIAFGFFDSMDHVDSNSLVGIVAYFSNVLRMCMLHEYDVYDAERTLCRITMTIGDGNSR